MGVHRSDCVIKSVEEKTPGGSTYNIILPGETDPKAICFRRKKQGDGKERCTNVAGYGTWHVGKGACKFHGGNAGRPAEFGNGRYAVMTKMRLHERVESYLDQDRSKLLDLTTELATVRAMFDEFMEGFPSPTDDDYGIAFHRFTIIIGTLGNLVEKISKIESRNTLTTAHVLYLRATIADLFMKYLPDPETRERAAKELAARLGGDVSLEMRPSEVRTTGLTLEG